VLDDDVQPCKRYYLPSPQLNLNPPFNNRIFFLLIIVAARGLTGWLIQTTLLKGTVLIPPTI
jgi:hypothetical protein